MIRQVSAALAILFLSAISSPAKALDTADIILSAVHIDTLKNCQKYCFIDICVSWHWATPASFFSSGSPAYFIFTPRIRHYNPDLVVSAYNLDASGNSLNPWDWARLVDDSVARPGGSTIVSILMGPLGAAGMGPGFASTSEQGGHRQLISREAAVVGHPLASLPSIMEGQGFPNLSDISNSLPDATGLNNEVASMAGDLGTSNRDSGEAVNPAPIPNPIVGTPAQVAADPNVVAKNTATGLKVSGGINKYAGLAAMMAPQYAGAINGIAQVAGVVNTVSDAFNEIQKINNAVVRIQEIRDALVGSTGPFQANAPGFQFTIDRFLCPSEVISFVPYYLSQLDVIGWRFAIPEMFYPEALIPGLSEIGNFPWVTWGSLYPRAGSLGSKNVDRAAAVFAQRAANIVTQNGQPHIYLYAAGAVADSFGNQINGGSKWQKLSPGLPEHTCTVFAESQPLIDVTGLEAAGAAALTDFQTMLPAMANQHNQLVQQHQAQGPNPPQTEQQYVDANGGQIESALGGDNKQGNFSWALWRRYNCCMSDSGHYLGNLSDGIGAVANWLGGLAGLDPFTAPEICLLDLYPGGY